MIFKCLRKSKEMEGICLDILLTTSLIGQTPSSDSAVNPKVVLCALLDLHTPLLIDALIFISLLASRAL